MDTETKAPWPFFISFPIALFGPPLLAMLLQLALPRSRGATGSIPAAELTPVVGLGLAILLWFRAGAGAKRIVAVCVTLVSTLLVTLLVFVGMMAP